MAATFAEFFAGIGLMRMGLEKAGWKCVFANDFDPAKARMYSGHFGETPLILDVADVDPGEVPRIELATASFPCADLSLAGGRLGLAGYRSSAVWPFLDLLAKLRPRPPLVMLENVLGLLTSMGGSDLERVLSRLADVGYSLDLLVVDAASFVPQSRPRLFIVGSSRPALPIPPLPDPYRPPRLAEFIERRSSLPWRILAMPATNPRRGGLADVLDHLLESDGQWWNEARTARLINSANECHRAKLHDHQGFATCFRRVREGVSRAEFRFDGIAGCLRTPKGGSAKQIVVEREGERIRARYLNARECARLMGADEYRIAVGETQALFGFGDAVCVPVVEWLAWHRLNPEIN